MQFPRSRKARRGSAILTLAALFCLSSLSFVSPGVSASAAVTQANGRIAFVSERSEAGGLDIYTMNPDGSGVTRLTTGRGPSLEPWRQVYNVSPAWSPDGTKIAFASNREPGSIEIYVMNADGSGLTRLTHDAVDDGQPAWSPDGTQIAFASGFTSIVSGNMHTTIAPQPNPPPGPQIHVMNADGSNRRQLTSGAYSVDPNWSPDGTKIAFHQSGQIFVMNADGSGQTQVTNEPTSSAYPAWSPDGTKIAFFGTRNNSYGIFVMNPDGSGVTRLTTSQAPEADPAWSPDGTKIAFTRRLIEGNRTNHEIYVMNADGSAQTRLTDFAGHDTEPAWQPAPATPAPQPHAEEWVPDWQTFRARVINTSTCNGTTAVRVRLIFPNSGYRVVDWGTVSHVGDQIFLDARIERWTGGSLQVITLVDNVYRLGELAPGTYTLVLRSYGNEHSRHQIVVRSDVPPSGNPLDDPEFFVRQHYLDFLGREADADGLAHWTNEITSCGDDAQCRERKRENVSAAFFLSIEFQETGYLVYRMHRASFGFPPPFASFLDDLRIVREGVIVGIGDWEERLAANKRAFVEAWVNRDLFQRAYGFRTNEDYVDTLLRAAGLNPQQAGRDALVAGLQNGTETRASVLLKIVEMEELRRREFNRAFVLMQYYGYLRRNVTDPPDHNTAGYDFWLAKLNEFNGDFIRSQMVLAFISSIEYRTRFCQQ